MWVLVVAAVTFGLCFILDKLFQRIFRNRQQHRSGLSVRLSKRYAAFGVILAVLGVAAILFGWQAGWLMPVAGGLIIVVGAGLVVYYMTFGVFYDEDSFLLTTFGKRSVVYRYADIQGQRLYSASGNILIELYLTDGNTVQLQSAMEGVYPFLDKAFAGWLRQTGRRMEDCPFHDPANSCWFPTQEE